MVIVFESTFPLTYELSLNVTSLFATIFLEILESPFKIMVLPFTFPVAFIVVAVTSPPPFISPLIVEFEISKSPFEIETL